METELIEVQGCDEGRGETGHDDPRENGKRRLRLEMTWLGQRRGDGRDLAPLRTETPQRHLLHTIHPTFEITNDEEGSKGQLKGRGREKPKFTSRSTLSFKKL